MATGWRSNVMTVLMTVSMSAAIGVWPASAQVSPVQTATGLPGTIGSGETSTPADGIAQAAHREAFADAGEPAPERERERVPFSHLFTDLGVDLTHLATRDTLLIAGVGAGLALAAHPADRDVTSRAFGSHALDETFDSGEWIGGGLVQVGGALVAYTVGRMSHHDKLADVGRDLVRAQVLNTVLTQGIKVAVRRERPDGTSFSFPSGHASTAFTTATVLTRYYGLKAAIPAYAVATFVSTNRLTENRHYLSDVAFGAAIGILAGRTSTMHIGGARFALAPAATPNGGVGVSLVRVQ